MESGASAQMSSLIRVLRVLELLPNLDQTIPAAGPRPMDLLRRKGKVRQRASASRGEAQIQKPWSWDDEA
jgi:hypothetical protein